MEKKNKIQDIDNLFENEEDLLGNKDDLFLLENNELTNLTEDEKILEQLRKYCNLTWICSPCIIEQNSKGGIITKIHYQLINEASSEDFYNWIHYVWPPAKTLAHTPKDYDNQNIRFQTFVNIVAVHKDLRLIFS